MKEIVPGITVDAGVHHGKPVVAGTRVPAETIVGHLLAGDSAEEVADQYGITHEGVLACVRYACAFPKKVDLPDASRWVGRLAALKGLQHLTPKDLDREIAEARKTRRG